MRWCWVGLGLVCSSLAAAELDYQLQPRKIAADTYVLEGSTEHFSRTNGGNIVNSAFIVTETGVVVIDSGPSWHYGRQLRSAIADITDKSIQRVYVTHLHPDHFLGNQAFQDVEIAALSGTIRGIEIQGQDFAANMYRLVGDWMRGTEPVPPTVVLQPGIEEFGGHRLELLALGGHAGDDLAIYDHTTRVLFAADLVFNQRTPTTPHAEINVWLADLERLKVLDFSVLVPGHGPVATDAQPTGGYRRLSAMAGFQPASGRGAGPIHG